VELTTELKIIFIETVKELKGYARRTFMARVVNSLGRGGQRRAAKEFGWCRDTIRKGQQEFTDHFCYIDRFRERGRKPAEAHLPHLLDDIRDIVDGQSLTDPTFQTTRLYTHLSAAEVRRQLIAQKDYHDAELPSEETIRVKLNQLGYYPITVKKCQPLKKIPETDAIFEQLQKVNPAADVDPSILRLSMDAKAVVILGWFSRGGKTRVIVKAWDHDFQPDETVIPFGIFLPAYDELYLYFTTSRITSDFISDCLIDFWLTIKERFPQVTTLVINQDNGRENHSRRTQFMKRITEFADQFQLHIHLAYYPPYHSKYNPVERVWGVMENHWRGSILDSIPTVLAFARTMTWNSQHPIVVKLVDKVYPTGVRLTPKEMRALETRLDRLPDLEKWFVRVAPLSLPP
jgi:transposase